MRFGFLITSRCNAACTHCTTSCGPNESAAIPHEKLLGLMDQGAALWKKHRARGEGLQFCISGGEPFLDFDRLVEAVAHGARLGARMTCVTNGFWASSDDKARQRLTALKQAGLASLAVSTSRFHQQFVNVRRVERALAVAKQVGIPTVLKCALTAPDQVGEGSLEQWARASGAGHLEIFPVAPYLREGARLPEGDYLRDLKLPRGRCPQPTLTVRESGTAYTCCMPGGFVDFLALGNVHETGLEAVYDRFYSQDIQQTLRHRGPRHFAEAIIASGEGHRLRDRYESVCDLCAHIASEPALAAVARAAARSFAAGRLSATLARIGGAADDRRCARPIHEPSTEEA